MSNDNFKDRLNRFQSSIVPSGKKKVQKAPPERYQRLAAAMGGELIDRQAGSYVLIRRFYSHDYRHGSLRLRDAAGVTDIPVSAYTLLAEEGTLDLSSMLFLDTETTGLGGSGVVAFLIGCGSLRPDGLEVRQYLIPDYADECAMLEDLLEEFGQDMVAVSYNGAAFDLPILKDRMIINRVAGEIEFGRHLDLLHATRRLFKRRLKDCTLGNIEQRLFDFKRIDDIPGYLVPSVYFDWLSEEQLDLMPGVLEHNRLDIVSLLFLAAHIARVGESCGEVLDQVDDLHSLSRVYGRRKQKGLVQDIYERIDGIEPGRAADDILLYHSMNFKRLKAADRAVAIWRQLAEGAGREAYWANIELAKHYEHAEKDPARARGFAVRAAEICPYGNSHRKQLTHRINRLTAGINRD